MSYGDDRCVHPGCGKKRQQHAEYEKGMWFDGHAFVEPAPHVESAAGFCGRCLDVSHCNRIGKCADRGEGDGDEAGRSPGTPDPDAAVRELAIRHVDAGYCGITNAMVAFREAFAAGRSLGRDEGAREEWEACMTAASTLCTSLEAHSASDIYDAIARREKGTK